MLLERVVFPDVRFGVACSGGADSIALLHLAAESGCDVVCLHVDHGLRPDSHLDAAFVEEACLSLGVAFDHKRVTVPDRPSMEAAAREVRYDALEELARVNGLDLVATAHTLDDQAETVLLRATRGGSLAGIAPRRGIFVRPLLGVRRGELRAWLTERDIPWREDPSNDELAIERNWTRHVLLPQLRDRRPGVANVLARLAQRTAEDESVLDAIALDVFDRAEIDDGGVFVSDVSELPRAIVRRVVRFAFREMGAEATEADVDTLFDMKRIRTRGVHAWFDDGLAVVSDPMPVPLAVRLREGVIDAPEWSLRLRVGDGRDVPWRWRTSMSGDGLVVRARQPGDRVRTAGGTKKVHDVLIDAKIPRALRPLVPIAGTSDEAVAVVGLTKTPDEGDVVLDAEPLDATWTTRSVWNVR